MCVCKSMSSSHHEGANKKNDDVYSVPGNYHKGVYENCDYV